MKEYIKKYFCIALAISMCLFLACCGGGSGDDDAEVSTEESTDVTIDDVIDMEESEDGDYDNGIYFEEEMDGAEVVTQKKSSDDFIGSWEATSGQAMYQYGNVELTIEADGTWTGNISDEDLEGKWKESGDGIYLTSSFFECSLAYTDSGVLVMQYDPEDDTGELITTVLSKK